MYCEINFFNLDQQSNRCLLEGNISIPNSNLNRTNSSRLRDTIYYINFSLLHIPLGFRQNLHFKDRTPFMG